MLLEFNRFLRMIIEGFKKEVLALFKKLEAQKSNRGLVVRTKREFNPLLRKEK